MNIRCFSCYETAVIPAIIQLFSFVSSGSMY